MKKENIDTSLSAIEEALMKLESSLSMADILKAKMSALSGNFGEIPLEVKKYLLLKSADPVTPDNYLMHMSDEISSIRAYISVIELGDRMLGAADEEKMRVICDFKKLLAGSFKNYHAVVAEKKNPKGDSPSVLGNVKEDTVKAIMSKIPSLNKTDAESLILMMKASNVI